MSNTANSGDNIKYLSKSAEQALSNNDVSTAVNQYLKILDIEPANAEIHYLIGKIYEGQRKTNQAIKFYENAFKIARNSKYGRSLAKWYIMGGRFKEANRAYEHFFENDEPNEIDLNNYALSLFYAGDRRNAAVNYAKLIELNPDNIRHKFDFIRVLTNLLIVLDTELLKRAFTICLRCDDVSCAPAANAWICTISMDGEFKTVFEAVSDSDLDQCVKLLNQANVTETLNKPFFSLGLTKLIHPSDRLEKLLEKTRRAVMTNPELSSRLEPFLCAMAAQNFMTDFPLFEEAFETEKVNSLVAKLEAARDSGFEWSNLLLFSLYRPLHFIKSFLEDPNLIPPTDQLTNLVKQQVLDHLTEQNLTPSIQKLGRIDNKVSMLTREQYEESPCPRWRFTQVPPLPQQVVDRTAGLKVLNAGCGTGLELINAAVALKNCHFVAIDLSLASLAYAKRQSDEIGLTNIDFVHGDILNVELLDQKFDLILSSGVLHHMEDTRNGLQKLSGILTPRGGRMLVGLYSKIARETLFSEIWEFIRFKKYSSKPTDIRRFRQDVLKSPSGHFLRNALKFRDFRSLSECRDMLFHARENLHTLPELEQFIGSVGLRVVGFLAPPDA